MPPLGGVGEHRVDVAQIAERGAIGGAAQPRHEVGALRDGAEQLALEAGVDEQRMQVLLSRAARCRAG